MFKEWIKADLLHLKEDPIENALVRYDIYKNEIEVQTGGLGINTEDAVEINGDKFIILEDKFYRKIVVTKKDNPKALKEFDVDTVYLMKGIHRDYLNQYGLVLFDGKKVRLVRTIDIEYIEKKYNTPGKIEKLKKFQRKKGYALIIDRDINKVKLKDKDFYKVLGHDKELRAFKKSNKLKMKKESDFLRMLRYYETLQ